MSGAKRIVSSEHALETLSKRQPIAQDASVILPNLSEEKHQALETPISNPTIQHITNSPSVHIDIQIHIDANAKTEQIEKIFESMAKYLYKK